MQKSSKIFVGVQELQVMTINSCDIEVVVHDQCHFMNFNFFCCNVVIKGITYPVIHIPQLMANMMVQIFESVNHSISTLASACNLVSQYLLDKSILL